MQRGRAAGPVGLHLVSRLLVLGATLLQLKASPLPSGVLFSHGSSDDVILRRIQSFNLSYGQYFERQYSTGWFTSPQILNTRLDSSHLFQLVTQRRRTHLPAFITADCVEGRSPQVLFNVLWLPNADNWSWALVFNLEGAAFQDAIAKQTAAGLRPAQVDSYAFVSQGTIYYAAVLVAKAKWAAGAKFDSAFGVPKGDGYCCGPNSRWTALQRAGMRPLSVSVTQDPVTAGMYVADVWISEPVQFWQAGYDKTAGEAQALLDALSPPLVPVFLKAYRQRYSSGAYYVFYSFIAQSDTAVSSYAATVDVSRSGVELLAKVLKLPPLIVTSIFLEAELDPADPTSGEMFSAVWQSPPPSPSWQAYVSSASTI